jgi:hypothetical protein
MTDGHAVMFAHLLPMAVIDFSKAGLMYACHAGGCTKSPYRIDAEALKGQVTSLLRDLG